MQDLNNRLVLSANRALWGNVTPCLRHASIEVVDGELHWQCILDKEANEEDMQLMEDASGEIISDFPEYSLKNVIEIHPYPEKVDYKKNLVYARNENDYYTK